MTAFLSLSHQQAFAGSTVWANLGATANWSDTNNWSGGVPGRNSDAFLQGSGLTYIYDPASSTIGSLTIRGDNGFLDIGANTLTVKNGIIVTLGAGFDNNLVNVNGGTLNGGAYLNSGALSLENSAKVSVASLRNSGVDLNGVDNAYTGVFGSKLITSGDLQNGGTISVNDSKVTVGGNYANFDSLSTAGPTPSLTLDNNSKMLVNGSFTNPALACGCASNVLVTHGSSLTVAGGFDNRGGALVLDQGNNQGMVGDFNMDASSVLGVGPKSTFTSTGAFGGLDSSTGTLSGSYLVAGTFQYKGGLIQTIGAAGSTLDGVGLDGRGPAAILATGGVDALSSLQTVNSNLTLQNGASLNTSASLTNNGFTGLAKGASLTSAGLTNNGEIQALQGSLVTVNGAAVNSNGAKLTLESGSTLFAGEMTNSGSLKAKGINGNSPTGPNTIIVGSTFTNTVSGNLTLGGGVNGGSGAQMLAVELINSGDVALKAAQDSSSTAASLVVLDTFRNRSNGTVEVGAGATLETDSFHNRGAVTIDGDLETFATYTQKNATSSTTVNGSLTAGDVDIVAGKLGGSGTITGNVTIEAGGVLAPGDPQMLTILGDLNQMGELDIEVDGADNSDPLNQQYDSVMVDGNVSLSGILMLAFMPGFTPTAGEDFTILTWTGLQTGAFSTIEWTGLDSGFTLQAIFGSNSLLLEVQPSSNTSVPEPASLLLLGSGVLALLARRASRDRMR